MLLEYGALVILILGCFFGPIIAGVLSLIKTKKVGLVIAAILITIYVIVIVVYTWRKANG